MDTYYTGGGIGASIVLTIGLIYSAINHKRIRSSCCGRSLDASIDIGDTTPETRMRIRNPEPITPKAKKENIPT